MLEVVVEIVFFKARNNTLAISSPTVLWKNNIQMCVCARAHIVPIKRVYQLEHNMVMPCGVTVEHDKQIKLHQVILKTITCNINSPEVLCLPDRTMSLRTTWPRINILRTISPRTI